MKPLFFLLLLTSVISAYAAPPKKISAYYDVTRDGLLVAKVTETYRQQGNQYQIRSETKGVGIFALLGIRILTSKGNITQKGLRPILFEQKQGKKKPIVANFDWNTGKLLMHNKGRVSTVDLEKGSQDLASFIYQFMFNAPKGDQFTLHVTTGKALRGYQYNVTSHNEPLENVLGGLDTIHLVNLLKDEEDGEEKELWLAPAKHYLPVKILFRDETGAKIEQVLTSINIE